MHHRRSQIDPETVLGLRQVGASHRLGALGETPHRTLADLDHVAGLVERPRLGGGQDQLRVSLGLIRGRPPTEKHHRLARLKHARQRPVEDFGNVSQPAIGAGSSGQLW